MPAHSHNGKAGVGFPTFLPNAVMRYVRIDFMNCRGRIGLTALPAAKPAERRASVRFTHNWFRF